jgi:hypothetical protein
MLLPVPRDFARVSHCSCERLLATRQVSSRIELGVAVTQRYCPKVRLAVPQMQSNAITVPP